jgi:putative ABC transport system permease protein
MEMRIEKNLRCGLSRPDAEAEARRHLGGMLRAKEGMREARVMMWLESVAADVRHGVRLLLRRPGLSALALLTLSLGIGANAAMFTLLNALLLQPLPYSEPDRLMAVVDRFTRLGVSGSPTIPEILDLRERSHAFSNIAFFDTRDFRMTGGDEPTRVFAAVSAPRCFRRSTFSRRSAVCSVTKKTSPGIGTSSCWRTACGAGTLARTRPLSAAR